MIGACVPKVAVCMHIRMTRREIAFGLVAVAGGGLLPSWASALDDQTALDLLLPPGRDPLAPTFDIFQALSRIVLIRSQLDEQVAARMFEVFKQEPYGPKHIGTAYAVLREEMLRRTASGQRENGVPLTALGSNERWFVGHLVTTWYLGIYYHPERPTQRITLEGALMYDAARGLVPVPFRDAVGFGAWAEPPG